MDFGKDNDGTIGSEQNGSRPVIALSSIKKGKPNMVYVVKVTSKRGKHSVYIVRIGNVNNKVTGYALVEQSGFYSVDRITTKVIGNVGRPIVSMIKERLKYRMK